MTRLVTAMCSHATESCDTCKPGNASQMAPVRSEMQFIDAYLPHSHGNMLYVTYAYTHISSPSTFVCARHLKCNVQTTCPSNSFLNMNTTSTCLPFSRNLPTCDTMVAYAESDASFKSRAQQAQLTDARIAALDDNKVRCSIIMHLQFMASLDSLIQKTSRC